jgi:hypothetical protein
MKTRQTDPHACSHLPPETEGVFKLAATGAGREDRSVACLISVRCAFLKCP